jgi:hypothetical protein
MKTKTHFDFRIDVWDDTGGSIVEHVAGADDFLVAEAIYRAAALADSADHLRQGARVAMKSCGPPPLA